MARLLRGFQNLSGCGIPGVLVTETIEPEDPRLQDPAFDIPKAHEIWGLIDKGTFQVVNRRESGRNANILGGKFFLAIKNIETDHPSHKARFFVQDHANCDK